MRTTSNMKAFLIVALILAAIFAFGCGKPAPTRTVRGWVVDKDYDPAWIQFIPISSGKTTTMTTIYHSARWDVEIAYIDTVYIWQRVDEEVYDQVSLSDTMLAEVRK